jgi:hypothetical protein
MGNQVTVPQLVELRGKLEIELEKVIQDRLTAFYALTGVQVQTVEVHIVDVGDSDSDGSYLVSDVGCGLKIEQAFKPALRRDLRL